MKFEKILEMKRRGHKIRIANLEEKLLVPFGEDARYIPLSFFGKIINGDRYTIAKRKKVKLKDLTKAEYRDFWQEEERTFGKKSGSCSNCIFKNLECDPNLASCRIYHKDMFSDKFLEQELEFDEIWFDCE